MRHFVWTWLCLGLLGHALAGCCSDATLYNGQMDDLHIATGTSLTLSNPTPNIINPGSRPNIASVTSTAPDVVAVTQTDDHRIHIKGHRAGEAQITIKEDKGDGEEAAHFFTVEVHAPQNVAYTLDGHPQNKACTPGPDQRLRMLTRTDYAFKADITAADGTSLRTNTENIWKKTHKAFWSASSSSEGFDHRFARKDPGTFTMKSKLGGPKLKVQFVQPELVDGFEVKQGVYKTYTPNGGDVTRTDASKVHVVHVFPTVKGKTLCLPRRNPRIPAHIITNRTPKACAVDHLHPINKGHERNNTLELSDFVVEIKAPDKACTFEIHSPKNPSAKKRVTFEP